MAERPKLSEQERADLVAFLDHELSGAAARRIETRLSLDPVMRSEANALKQSWDLLDLLPRAEPSPLFTSRTLEKVSAAKQRPAAIPANKNWKPWIVGVGWAAALFLATWVGFSAFKRVPPREPTEVELVLDIRVIENRRLYELVDDVDFLHELDHPDLFGDETSS